MLLLLSRTIHQQQWNALIVQVSGIIRLVSRGRIPDLTLSRFNPVQALALGVTQLGNANLNYSPSVYAILLGMTCISSIAGVMNDHLCKTTDASLHAQNMVLYSFGVVINLIVFVFIKLSDPEGVPAFWSGYNSVGAVSLVFLNASLGLIITAVYKCAYALS